MFYILCEKETNILGYSNNHLLSFTLNNSFIEIKSQLLIPI